MRKIMRAHNRIIPPSLVLNMQPHAAALEDVTCDPQELTWISKYLPINAVSSQNVRIKEHLNELLVIMSGLSKLASYFT